MGWSKIERDRPCLFE